MCATPNTGAPPAAGPKVTCSTLRSTFFLPPALLCSNFHQNVNGNIYKDWKYKQHTHITQREEKGREERGEREKKKEGGDVFKGDRVVVNVGMIGVELYVLMEWRRVDESQCEERTKKKQTEKQTNKHETKTQERNAIHV